MHFSLQQDWLIKAEKATMPFTGLRQDQNMERQVTAAFVFFRIRINVEKLFGGLV